MRRLTFFFIFAVCFLIFFGCGQKREKERNNTEFLKNIALDYWNNRLIDRNYEKAYAREIDVGKPDFKKYKKLASRTESFPVFRFEDYSRKYRK